MLAIIILFTLLFLYGHAWHPKDTSHFYKIKPLVFGHRGDVHRKPENTISSFMSAVKKGIPAIEMDVVSTTDGIVMCSHNFDLERKTPAEGMINDLTHHQLKTIADSVPTLEEALQKIPESTIINVEIKTRGIWDIGTTKRVVRIIQKQNRFRNIILSSFNPIVVLLAKILDGRMYTALIFWDKKWLWFADWVHPDFLHPEYGQVSADLLRYAKERSLPLNVWTVNSKSGIENLGRRGIAGIITDRPEYCVH